MGIILGEPTGINAKFWTATETAIDMSLGYSFTSSNSIIDFYGDYVFHHPGMLKAKENFVVYYGPGVGLRINEGKSRLGIRGVIGILWLPADSRFDLFAEFAPILDIIPETKIDFSGGIGGRFFFN
ncbi:MAG: hypothetical protein JSW63_03245 [Ignavibacterium sp.]|nr:MAG: hypothetical protein JSW63_03245 [Ignavibacterium sp.]